MARVSSVLAMMIISSVACLTVRGDDWPQWLGPQRDSVWRETGIVKTFPEGGLKVRWRAPVADGYAGPAVADGKVYVADYARESGEPTNGPGLRAELTGQERVLCFDAEDGSLEWEYKYDCPYKVSYPRGPRVTPTISGGKVYTLGAMGNLCCLDAQSGILNWSKDLKATYKIDTPQWGFAGHPLVHGRKLICLVGGEGSVAVAFDKDTGEELWRALSASEPGYCPPTMIEAAGRKQLILWHAEEINSLNPETGEAYWSVPLEPDYGMSIATPRSYGDYLFASGVNQAGMLLKLGRQQPSADIVWRSDARSGVYCANSSPFVEDGVLYGVCKKGELRAVDLRSGKRLWETYAATSGSRGANYGTAFLVKHEDRFFLFNDKGDLIIAKLSSSGYEELSRFHLLEPTNEAFGRPVVWTHPAFADKAVFARNDRELVCVSLAAD